jgi:hypothetical protein
MSKTILVNDYLYGSMGERVLWDFMLEGIPNLIKVDIDVIRQDNEIHHMNIPFEQKVSLYIEKYHSNYRAIIQNGSWFSLIHSSKPRIALIQDNLRKMGRISSVQEYNYKNAEYIVTNSNEVDQYYNQRKTVQIPLGVDNKLFSVLDKTAVRNKYKIDTTKYNHVGIFVGAMNEVKGWSRINNIINNNLDTFWIIVSKHKETLNIQNGTVYNQINQTQLCELYNCADFFIIGSPSETQCLAAIECCLCDVPIIMRDTGFVTNLSSDEKNKIGIIGDNLEEAVYTIKNNKNKYTPREICLKYYSIDEMCNKWIKFLDEIC